MGWGFRSVYMRRLPSAAIALVATVSAASAGSATQTSWSGGPGVWGPVVGFGSGFLLSEDIDWLAVDVGLRLLPKISELEPYAPSVYAVACGDLDGDGDTDLACGCSYPERVVWMENLLGSGWTEHLIYSGSSEVLTLGDIDGNGTTDLVTRRTSQLMWWEYAGGTWIGHEVLAPSMIHTAVAADLDGDGDTDIAGVSTGNAFSWFENLDGSGTEWEHHFILSDCWHALGVGDIDGDGDSDLVTGGGNQVLWFERTPSGTWIQHLIGTSGVAALRIDDIDGDGDPDVAGVASGTAAWWENPGNSIDGWPLHLISDSYLGGSCFGIGDITGDGLPEILTCSPGADNLLIWWERGTEPEPPVWCGRILSEEAMGYSWLVLLADIDGDGLAEPLAGSPQDHLRSWMDDGFEWGGSLESSVLDTGTNPVWGTMDWEAETPAGAEISFQVRASDNYVQMGEWSDTLSSPGSLQGILEDGDRYVQYRVILHAGMTATPILHSITLQWDEVGLSPQAGEAGAVSVYPNPCIDGCTIRIPDTSAGPAAVRIWDTAGRLAESFLLEDATTTDHEIFLDDLAPGLYLVQIEIPDGRSSCRLMVLGGRS